MGNIINRVFDSAGPEGRVRGTPQQIIDKYQALGRDAQVSGDRVAAESFLQHAEHYSRLLGEAQRQQQEARQAQDQRDDQQPRHDQRGDQRAQGQERDDDRRDDDRRDDDRRDDGRRDARPQRQQGGAVASEASGLTTIDTDDERENGPVDTPESRQGGVNGAHHAPQEPAAAGEAAPESAPPAKRPRTRRRAKPEAGSDSDTPAAAE